VTSGATFTLIDPTGANPQILELNGYGPTWSPEGDRIAYTSAGVSVIDVTTREITAIPVFGESPAWSPDGEFVAFTRLPVGQEGQNIYTARLDGSDERKLTTGEQNLWPDWQPIPGNRQPADCDFSLPASDQLPAGGGRPDGSPARNATMPFLPGLALMFASALWIAWQLRRQPNSPTGK
jgi:hypothetical protein